jgi:uncharacterized protein YqeY
MGLKETLKTDLTEAIRSSDKVVSGTIRMVLTAITNEEVSGKEARVLTDDEIITVLSREAKKRREAAEEFAKAGRAEKAEEEKAEGEVIAKYLPAQLSEEDIKALIAAAVASTGAAGPADMGKVMGAIKPQIAGKADGSLVSSLVKAALAGGNYEYATVPLLSHATKQILDTWGSDGWELVTVIPAPGGEQLVAYMKREVK